MHARDRAAAGNDAAGLAAVDAKYPNRGNHVVMPLIPWNPYQNDFSCNEILPEIQRALDQPASPSAPSGWPAANGLPNWPMPSTTAASRRCWPTRPSRPLAPWPGLARSGAMPSLAGLGSRAAARAQRGRSATTSAPTPRAATWPRGCSTAFASRSSSRSS